MTPRLSLELNFSITFINLKGIGSKNLPVLVHIFTVQVVILFNRQLIKLWKGAQTPLEKLEKFFFSLFLKVHCKRKEGML